MAARGGSEAIAKKIKALKIQGARRIAKAALMALAKEAEKSRARNTDELLSDLLVAADRLAAARETEPMLRNSLDDFISVVRVHRGDGVRAIKAMLSHKQEELLGEMEASVARVAYYGAELLPDNGTVLVHCHSTTLMSILKLGRKQGKKFKVYCTETRPKYQGRISAATLAGEGIDTTLIVDSCAASIIRDRNISMALFGADALTERGELLNKIGTYQIAMAAKKAGAKVFSAAELYKYDQNTEGGRPEPIEERDASELADGKKMLAEFKRKKVRIFNPAFDLTPPELIDGFITEDGIISPQGIGAAGRARRGKVF